MHNKEVIVGPTVGSTRNIKPTPASEGGTGEFSDVILGFRDAPTSDLISSKDNAAFPDGHLAAHPSEESFRISDYLETLNVVARSAATKQSRSRGWWIASLRSQ